MEEIKAHKVQNTHGVKGNRNVEKPDFVSPHRRSKVKSIKDPRTFPIQLRLVHPTKAVQVKTIEAYQLEKEIKKWEGDNYKVFINN